MTRPKHSSTFPPLPFLPPLFMSYSPNTTEIEDLVKISPPLPPSIAAYEKMSNDFKDRKGQQQAFDDVKVKLETIEVEEVDVQRMVEDTVRRVREQSDKIQAAAKPYADKTRNFAEERPVLFTFLAIFTVLSIIPVSIFIGFLISSTLFVLTVAAVGICLSILFSILLACSILLPVLFFTCLVSLSILTFLLSLFLIHRLYLHLSASTSTPEGGVQADYENLSKGVRSWIDETAGRLPDMPLNIQSLHLGPLDQGSGGQTGRRVIAPGLAAPEVDSKQPVSDHPGKDAIKQES